MTKIRVDKEQKELTIDCGCGHSFIVSGNIPTHTVCDSCSREVSLKVPLRMLSSQFY